MGNKINDMSICSRKNYSARKAIDDDRLSSFVSHHSVSDFPNELTERSSIYSADGDDVQVSDFNLLKVLGTGAFGKVFLVQKNSRSPTGEGKLYAMKVLRKEYIMAKNQYEHTMTERRVLEELNSPFIVSLAYAFQTEDKLYLVMEYVAGGELFYHLKMQETFKEDVIRFFASEIITAIGHLHGQNIVYRDLKPENILIDKNGHLKLTDFGLSKDGLNMRSEMTFSICGTPEYIAPEII